jgi:N-acetylmuramoyl-L-alanine amidase
MIVLLDNGHGGIINNEYQTPGKRSPKWADGSQLFEGEFNRAIVNGIIQELTRLKIPYVNIAPEYIDISLEERMKRANAYATQKCFYLSVHSNAGGGKGSEIYTSVGQTASDKIATIFCECYKLAFPDRVLRTDTSDGDPDKESNFYVLKNTKMPALLTENFFMDNEEECKSILMSKTGREKIIDWHVKAILRTKAELFK